MYNPSISEAMTVHMLDVFRQYEIEDTIETRLGFLETTKKLLMEDPALGVLQCVLIQIAITTLIFELKVELAIQNRS